MSNQQPDAFGICHRCDAVRHVRKLQETLAWPSWLDEDELHHGLAIKAYICAEGCHNTEMDASGEVVP